MIIKCVCQHDFQDKRYGFGNRVFNMCKKSIPQVYRCTVCKRTVSKGVPIKGK